MDERQRGGASDTDEQELDEGSEPVDTHKPPTISFHDLLKAEGMRISVPLQMVRPKGYQGKQLGKKRGARTLSVPLQDEATRAWNIHTALHYNAGGIPWACSAMQRT